MQAPRRRQGLLFLSMVMGMTVLGLSASSLGQTLKQPTVTETPPKYKDMHMPKGWWTDPKVIAAGKKVFEGMVNSEVVCAACHGRDGTPILTGTRDLRDTVYVNQMTDSYWFWRIAEGVPGTPMLAWKEKGVTNEEIWQIMAYEHTFTHGGKAEEHVHGK